MRLLVVVAAVLVSHGAAAASQDPANEKAPEEGRAQEIGGRLVISGGTVLVVADPDRPRADASIATKTDTPLLETPRSVSVTERRTLDDRQAVNVADAHDYTVGLMPADERGPAFARGFPVSFYDLRRDGLRTYAWSVREPVALERVQYLRGPAAILYGDGSPGALVNLVLRKPLPAPLAELTAALGEDGFGRLTGDVTGPIGASRRVRYRVIGASEWTGNGFDNGERRLSLVPTLSIDLGSSATLHLDGELYHQRGRSYRHSIPATPETERGDFSSLPWDLNPASPDSGWSGWNASPGARLDLQLGARTSLHTAVRYTRIGGDLDLEPLLGLAADGRTISRYTYREQSTWDEFQTDTFLTATRSTGSVSHRLVLGAEAGLSTADSEIGTGAAAPLDLHAPVYAPRLAVASLRPTRYDVLRFGVYAQDQMRVHPAITVVPGVRLSRLGIDDRVASDATRGFEQDASDVKVSPSLGLVVLPRPWLSLYASGASGFEPPTPGQYQENGRALLVAESLAIEGGVKLDALSRRLSLTGSAFRIRRTNVPEADGLGFYRQIGEGRSTGIELEAVGSVAPGLAVQAAYAWMTTEVTRSDSGNQGHALPNAPPHKASLWVRYRLLGGPLSGLMLAAGVVHASDRFIAADNVVTAPAYTRLDVSASWETRGGRLRIGLAAPNATDARYVTSGAGRVLWAGPPRRITLQVATRF